MSSGGKLRPYCTANTRYNFDMKTLCIPLDEERWKRLERAAQARNLTPDQLALEAIEAFVQQSTRSELYEQALRVVGKYRSGVHDTSERHDFYLAQAYLPESEENDAGVR